MTLRGRLTLLIVAATIPALAMIVYNGLHQRALAEEGGRRDTLRLVHVNVDAQRRFVSEARRLLALLGRLPEVRGGDPAQCGTRLTELLPVGGAYTNFGVVNPDGRLMCSAVPIQKPVSFADRPYFQQIMGGRDFAISEYLVGRLTGVPSVVFAAPVRGDDGRVQGVVYAALSLSWLAENIPHANLPPGSVFTVLDRNGRVLARYPDPGRWIGVSASGTAVWKLISGGKQEGTVEAVGLEGVRRLYAFAPLFPQGAGHQQYLSVGIPAKIVYGDANTYLMRSVSSALAIFLLTLLVAWWGAQVFVVRRLSDLVRVSRRLAAGDLAARARTENADREIAALGGAFNDMADALAYRDQEALRHIARIKRLNRIYAVLGGINSAIIRIRNRDELLQEACDIAVRAGEFRLVWIGLVDEKQQVVPVRAVAGAGRDAFRDMRISTREDEPEGMGPSGIACRTGSFQVFNDIDHTPSMEPWRGLMGAYGLRSVAAFPLKFDGRVTGIMTFYTGEPDFFDDEEVKLLEELAADTSLGLSYIEKEEQLHYAAYYDRLTGLPNRNLLNDRFAHALEEARRHGRMTALLFLDLDRFKQVNDTFGHEAGDQLLCGVARRLKEILRGEDTVARLGGDEYAIVLEELTSPSDAAVTASKILRSLSVPLRVGGHDLFISASVGIAIYPQDGEDIHALLKNADAAMYSAKEAGRASFQFYQPAMTDKSRDRLALELGLRRALDRNELFLLFQPQQELATGRIVGVEALVRWMSPDRGLVPPSEFIPMAEEIGLILPLGEWVLREACKHLKFCQALSISPIRMSVNVSAPQVQRRGFVDVVNRIIQETGVAAEQLELEITESVLMEGSGEVQQTLEALRALGVRFSIDDFGTGYSSLSYLKRMPIDKLKIDQSFVRDLSTDPNDAAITRAIIAMAHSLRLTVIAEGVETESQREFLVAEGCDEVQGYLIGRPVGCDQLRRLLSP